MVSLPRSPATNLLRFLFLGLSTLASPSQAQLELHVPAGLTKLKAVEGAEVVLPVWYTLQGQVSSGQTWELLTVMWFLEQEGKDLNQVLAYINRLTSKQRVSLDSPCPPWRVALLTAQDIASGRKTPGPYGTSVNTNVRDHQGINRSLAAKLCRAFSGAGTAIPVGPGTPSAQSFLCTSLDAIRGSLSLTNLSSSMSGVYICKAHNEVGSAQCNVTLEVSTGPGPAVVAGAVVGTLVGLGLLAGLVLLYHRRSKALEEPANDIKEDAIAPPTLPWPKGSDTISKNGTLSSVTSARALRQPQGPPRPGALTPTPSLSSQVRPSPRLLRTDGAHPQPTSPSPGGVSSSTLSRMGAVPVMVPAQSQAGSLV
ncbi:endothelial cell-selective adhesion molecule [Puma concolor]|uniref:Endothelial cell-selective adhesion molecule n=1 Tax=Puma concolor TaxID=9696 RepID=A0A6P6I957_PUMCO|nr:endothelial cell-selective adhesion molecule [Puma concolor]